MYIENTEKKIIAVLSCGTLTQEELTARALVAAKNGADEILLDNQETPGLEKKQVISLLRKIHANCGCSLLVGTRVESIRDAKELLYAGASRLLFWAKDHPDPALIRDIIARFEGNFRILLGMEEKDLPRLSEIKSDYRQEDGSTPDLLLRLPRQKDGSTSDFLMRLSRREESARPEELGKVLIWGDFSQNVREAGQWLAFPGCAGIVSEGFSDQESEISHLRMRWKEENQKQIENAGEPVDIAEDPNPFSRLKKGPDGLVPCIAQDADGGRVLMLGYMNEEALNHTLRSGLLTFYSRSRQTLWVKGETSGNFMQVERLRVDCDRDTILATVHPCGPACHTGAETCFFTDLYNPDHRTIDYFHMLTELEKTMRSRMETRREGSYTSQLFDAGLPRILQKCGEESVEMVIAGMQGEKEEVRYETADLLYHIMVMLAALHIPLRDIMDELITRHVTPRQGESSGKKEGTSRKN